MCKDKFKVNEENKFKKGDVVFDKVSNKHVSILGVTNTRHGKEYIICIDKQLPELRSEEHLFSLSCRDMNKAESLLELEDLSKDDLITLIKSYSTHMQVSFAFNKRFMDIKEYLNSNSYKNIQREIKDIQEEYMEPEVDNLETINSVFNKNRIDFDTFCQSILSSKASKLDITSIYAPEPLSKYNKLLETNKEYIKALIHNNYKLITIELNTNIPKYETEKDCFVIINIDNNSKIKFLNVFGDYSEPVVNRLVKFEDLNNAIDFAEAYKIDKDNIIQLKKNI